jgi:SAM-dependent methyltransferase
MHPALKALLAQLGGWTVAIALASSGWLSVGIWALVGAQAGAAVALAAMLGSARWWLAIHLCFAPLLVLASALRLSPAWYLGAFVMLTLVYWTSFRTQVPLYLSSRAAARAVHELLPPARACRVLDLGSGTGSLLASLARRRPDCLFTGIEAAPAPYLISRVRARRLPNLRFERGDFFTRSWSQYDVVYAFLSPVPMALVWDKARRELGPAGLLVSNSFAVPDAAPERVIELPDTRRTALYLYRPGARPVAGNGGTK